MRRIPCSHYECSVIIKDAKTTSEEHVLSHQDLKSVLKLLVGIWNIYYELIYYLSFVSFHKAKNARY